MSQRLNVLVVSTFVGGNANVIRDFLFAFHAHSKHRYYYVYAPHSLGESFDFKQFDVIVVFWSVYLLGPGLTPAVRERIRQAPALKVLFLQDEYRDVRLFNQKMAELGVNVMCTCVREEDHDLFYPKALIPSLRAVHTVLTGYVPDGLDEGPPDVASPRPIDIGYRSRAVPWVLGDLGQEKTTIATRFQEISARHGFKSDISVLESDRIYGDAWTRFLKASRYTLGTESGASLIDFTGEIKERCEAYVAAHPDATYAELRARHFADVDGKVVLAAISPRVFECAAAGNVLIFHEGHYSGIAVPDRHFIPVKKDYSNVGEVVERMRDTAYCRQLVGNAYQDLIRSGRYGYRQFIGWFDNMISAHVPQPRRLASISRPAFYSSRWLDCGQNLIPWGADYREIPTRADVASWPGRLSYQLASFALQFTMLLAGVLKIGIDAVRPARPPAPVAPAPVVPRSIEGLSTVQRFMLDPVVYLKKAVVLANVLMLERELRELFIAGFLRRGPQERPPLDQFSEDLVKLAILLRMHRQGGALRRCNFVAVSVDGSTLKLVSADRPAESARTNGEAAERLRESILRRRVTSLEWDHSSRGEYAEFRVTPTRNVKFFVGPGSRHQFPVLRDLMARCPEAVWRAVQPLAR